LTEIVSLVIGFLLGVIATRFQYRADRRDAERFRRELAAESRAALRMASDYYASRISLWNDGPADATEVKVTDVTMGPRSRMTRQMLLEEWGPVVNIPVGAEHVLRIPMREEIGNWIELTVEWKDSDGSARRRIQRLHWAG